MTYIFHEKKKMAQQMESIFNVDKSTSILYRKREAMVVANPTSKENDRVVSC